MAALLPPPVDPLPTGPSIDRIDDFDEEADAFVAAQQPYGQQLAALGQNVYQNTVTAFNSAVTAAADALTASQAADDASEASIQAIAAAQTSVNAAAGFSASSTTSNVVGTGLKTFVVDPNKTFFRGMFVSGASQADIGKYVTGQVDSFSGPNLIINVKTVGTPGAVVNDWIIGPSGAQGSTGPVGSLAGTNLTGALNAARAADVVSANGMDIWSGAGNLVVVTGDANISMLANAPQAGAERNVLIAGKPTLFSSANLDIKGVRFGRSITLGPGDELDVTVETVTRVRVTITRADGSSPSERSRMHSTLLAF